MESFEEVVEGSESGFRSSRVQVRVSSSSQMTFYGGKELLTVR